MDRKVNNLVTENVFGGSITVDKDDVEKGKMALVDQACLLFETIVRNNVDEFVNVKEDEGGKIILSYKFLLEK